MRIDSLQPQTDSRADGPRGERSSRASAESPFDDLLGGARGEAPATRAPKRADDDSQERRDANPKKEEKANDDAAAAQQAAASAPVDPARAETPAAKGEHDGDAKKADAAAGGMSAANAKDAAAEQHQLSGEAADSANAATPEAAKAEPAQGLNPKNPSLADPRAAAPTAPAAPSTEAPSARPAVAAAESQPKNANVRTAATSSDAPAASPAEKRAADAPAAADGKVASPASKGETQGNAPQGNGDTANGRPGSEPQRNIAGGASAAGAGVELRATAAPATQLSAPPAGADAAPAAAPAAAAPINMPTFAVDAATPNTNAASPTFVPASVGARVPQLPPGADVESVIRQVVVHLRPNSTELRLRLDPPGLGELRLRFVYEAGRVRARLRASEPATVELLRSHADDLGRAMRDAGIDLSDLDVHEDRPRGRALAADAADDAPARRSQRSEPAAEPQRTEVRPARRPHAGAVDLFV